MMQMLVKKRQFIWGLTCNTPVKNSGEITDNVCTARRDAEIVLNTCPNTNKVSSFKQFKIGLMINSSLEYTPNLVVYVEKKLLAEIL